MPVESYIVGHSDAQLTPEQKQALINYFKKVKEETERSMVF